MTTSRPPQHVSVVAREALPIAPEARPEAGPIAVLPEPRQIFLDAVAAGGGEAAPISDATRGLIWLSSDDPAALVETLAQHPDIGWVQLPWAGVDAFADVLRESAIDSKVLWTSAKGAYSQPVAEHALLLALAPLRELPVSVFATSWSAVPLGRSLFGLDVVIIGAGGIALELIRLLRPFGVRITVVRRSDADVEGAALTVTVDRLAEVLPFADVVVVAAALTDSTAKLIGAAELAVMRPGSVLVNIARGGLVDSDALLAAIRSGHLAGAGLDVTDPEPLPDGHPLWLEQTVIVTSHNADTPEMTAPLLAERIRSNVEAFHGDGRFIGIVDPAAGY